MNQQFKTIAFSLMFLFPFSFAQVPDAAVVVAVEKGNQISLKSLMETVKEGKLLTQIGASMKGLEQAQKLNNSFKTLQTLKDLYKIIENTACVYKEFENVMNLSAGLEYDDCFVSFKYNIALTKYTFSLEMIDVIVSTISQSTGERNKTLNDVIKNIEESTNDIKHLTNLLKRGLIINLNDKLDNFINSTYYNPYNIEDYNQFNI